MIIVGELLNKGIGFRFDITKATGIIGSIDVSGFGSGNVVNVEAPTGGMGQFKGLTQGTAQDDYVKVICTGVQPLYYTTYPQKLVLTTSENGFVFTCYTGIPQCAQKISSSTLAVITDTEQDDCIADPRY